MITKQIHINDSLYTADLTRFILEGLAEIDEPSDIELVESDGTEDVHYITVVRNGIAFKVEISIIDFL